MITTMVVVMLVMAVVVVIVIVVMSVHTWVGRDGTVVSKKGPEPHLQYTSR